MKRFDELVLMNHAPVRRSHEGYSRNNPMLAYCIDSVGNSWRYDMETNYWLSLVDPEFEAPTELAPTTVPQAETSVLVVVDNTRETFITLLPHNSGGPVTVFSENCDAIVIGAREPELFPTILRQLLDFTDNKKMEYFNEVHAEPVLKIDDLLMPSLDDDPEMEFDPEKFIYLLGGMPAWDGLWEPGEDHEIYMQFRFVESFLTSKERGLAVLNSMEIVEIEFPYSGLKALKSFLGMADLTPDQEKKLWRECSRVASEWGRQAGINRRIQYSLIPSFFLRAAMTFDMRSFGLMDRSKIIVGDIERSVQRVVILLLKRIYGNNYWTKLKPPELRRGVDKRRRGDWDREHPMNHLYLKEYKLIVENQWEDFRHYFTLLTWPEYNQTFSWLFRECLKTFQLLRWFDALCYLRNRAYHPTRKPLSPNEFRFLEDVQNHFESVEAKLSG